MPDPRAGGEESVYSLFTAYYLDGRRAPDPRAGGGESVYSLPTAYYLDGRRVRDPGAGGGESVIEAAEGAAHRSRVNCHVPVQYPPCDLECHRVAQLGLTLPDDSVHDGAVLEPSSLTA